MRKAINLTEIALGILFLIYYAICGISNELAVPILYLWLILGAVLIVKGVAVLLFGKQAVFTIFDVVLFVFLSGLIAFSCFVVIGMNDAPDRNCDYVIVLGAEVSGNEPSEVLRQRIDAAYDYLIENENTIAVCTGGLGGGVEISEGECAARELIKRGIPESRIMFEDKSRTTVENFRFALEKITDEPKSIAVVSSGFHISRAKLILSCFTDAEVSGLPATGFGLLTPHYIAREYIVFLIDLCLGNYRI